MDSNWIDITTTIRHGMVHWPGDTDVEITRPVSMADGADANVTNLSMSAHISTHVDAPLHFIRDGNDVCSISFDRLIGPVRIIQIKDKHRIEREEIVSCNISEGERLLFRTINSESDWSMMSFRKDYVFLSTAAAKYLIEKKVKTIGVDYLSVAGEENGLEVHRLLLGQEILIIEGLNLRHVESGNYEMICLPLKIEGADGAPARVVIRKIRV